MRAVAVAVEELKKISFLHADALGDRHLSLPSYWDGTRWSCWVPQEDGSLFEMHPADCLEGSYVARAAALPSDIHLPFADFMWRRIGWANVVHWQAALLEDVHQMAASLDKLAFLWTSRGALGDRASTRLRRFVTTEIEYLLLLSRSAFDLLQQVVRAVWKHIRLRDPQSQKAKRELGPSFARMVLHDKEVLSSAEIASKRSVPPPLAEIYAAAGRELVLIRRLRDAIAHEGVDAPQIYVTERGFSIPRDQAGFRDLPIWTEAHRDNEQLVSLRPALAWIAGSTIGSCNAFTKTLGEIFELPADIAPEHHVFLRTPHASALVRTLDVLEGGSPWWSDDT